jgi:hypothetical protein
MLLITLTITSCALAAAFGILAWRFARAERLRSDARVAALAVAIEGSTERDASAPAMFSQTRPSPVQGHPLLKLAIGFAFAVSVIVVIAMTGDRPMTNPAEPVATSGAPASLELVSMRHQRGADALTVTGLVRNAGPATAGEIIAVVFAFDRDGNYVASGRAALDFPALASGDESPFTVSVPDVQDVGRYRVSFRTETGVVRHVDRRPALSAASARRPGVPVSAN